MTWTVILVSVLLAIPILYFIFVYNKLIQLENRVDNSWSQIDVQLKKRADLIPNLVNTVKGYAKHEKGVFTEVTKARSALKRSKKPETKMKNNNMLTQALGHLFAVAENYPKLRASENFMQLQEELSGIEGKIAYARQFYNDSVLKFNNMIEMFPSNIVASIASRNEEKPYFEATETERKNVNVSF